MSVGTDRPRGARSLPLTIAASFLGHASHAYKLAVVAALVLNIVLWWVAGPVVAGWAIVIEFILTLALSLHAPDDELRDELVPINTRWRVDEALDAAYRYFEATGRRVSIEYALIRDINDQAWRADLLGEKLTRRGRGWVHVNPIPLNPTPGSRWTASRPGVAQQFVERLRAHGIPTTVRDTRGREIDGACGQLAATTA